MGMQKIKTEWAFIEVSTLIRQPVQSQYKVMLGLLSKGLVKESI